MLNRLRLKSDFSTNIATLLTGTAVAQAIPIAVTPILTRLYTPSDFGVLALFLAISTLFGSIANGRYELAIMLPEEDDDAINVAALCVLIASSFSLLLLLVVIVFNESLVTLLGNPEIAPWLYLIPITVWGTGFFNALNYLNTRSKNFKDIATTRVYKSVILASINLAYGLIKSGAAGLIWGQVASQLLANVKLLKNGLNRFSLDAVSTTKIKQVFSRYIGFLKFNMWAVLANNLSNNLLSILISGFYSVATLGHFSIAQKLLGIPSTVIGSAISQVYFKGAVEEKSKTGKASVIFKKTTLILFSLSCATFIPLYFLLPGLFAWVLGEEWRVAGEYSKILLPFYFIRFISSSVSISVSVFEKNRLSLVINILILTLSMLIFFLATLYEIDFVEFLNYYSISMALLYGAFLYLYWILAKGNSSYL